MSFPTPSHSPNHPSDRIPFSLPGSVPVAVVVTVQSLIRVQFFETHWLQHARLPCPSLSSGVWSNSGPLSWWCHPTISSSVFPLFLLPSIFPSIRFFSNESQVAKVLDLQLQHQSFQYSGLISFRIDWFDLLAVEGTFESLLQHHSSKSSILWCSVFFMIQLSYPYMTNEKTIAFPGWTFVSKETSCFLICCLG